MALAPSPSRIASLDVIRGVAVMGILVANLPGFGLPEAAYFSPLAWSGTSPADLAAWFATFVLVEGKMRGLFSFLFGASMLLVIDRAEAAGESGAATHFRRMAALLLIGCLHLYLLWWGDILSHYALVGALAYMFHRLPVRWLLIVAGAMIALQTIQGMMGLISLLQAAPRITPQQIATWNDFANGFGRPPPDRMMAEIVAHRGGFAAGVAYRWTHVASPMTFLPIIGFQTLSAMLLGMAGYRSGFLTGKWTRKRYRRWAAVGIGVTLPIYAALAFNTGVHGFDQRWVYIASIVAVEPVRPLAVAGIAALVILLVRPGGWLTSRVAAVGRSAFTNYLGTTVLMTFVFDGWGLGRFARWGRAELYLLVVPAWAIMLAWSPAWLARYRYGPMEWLWRSIARLARTPMRGSANATG